MTPTQIAEAQSLTAPFEDERRKRTADMPDIMAALKRSLEARGSGQPQ